MAQTHIWRKGTGRTSSVTQAMVKYVEENPGCSSLEVYEGLDQPIKAQSVGNMLSYLARKGVMENRNNGTGRGHAAQWYVIESSASDYSRKLAQDILSDMAKLHTSVREDYLAEKLDELFEEQS